MDVLLEATLVHLRALVGFDTRNPPRAIDTGGIFDYLRKQLTGFQVQVIDHGAGAVSLFALRGRPRLLFNVHLDTVPASPQWTRNPLELAVDAERAVGLGACDIKGAAAALLAVVNATQGDAALLFTTDEEDVDPRCVRAFLKAGREFEAVIVAEPTRCQTVLAHRGIQAVRVCFRGRAGHASAAQQPADSALHQAVRWGAAALDYAGSLADEQFGELQGLRFNLGRIEGGIKANIIAPETEVRFGMRPLPSTDMDRLLEHLRALADPAPALFEETFRGPPLPADFVNAAAHERAARALAERLGMPVGGAVDFWTEAALFSQAGYTTFVYGPGDIAQAHSADEWVALDDLSMAAQTYLNILENTA